jgi:branched-chain amino acid aminotransferase
MVNFNGIIMAENQAIFSAENRAFRYGDGLFETIRSQKHTIPLFHLHKQRLLAGMQALAMDIPAAWHEDFLEQEIHRLLRAFEIAKQKKTNIVTPNATYRLRLAVFRDNGGLYTPKTNAVSFCIELSVLAETEFSQNNVALQCSIFDEIAISPSKISPFKTSNALVYVLAAIFRQAKKVDDCFILNTKGNICETVSANIFGISKENYLVTPPIAEGCIDGIMRKVVLEVAKQKQIPCIEKPITKIDLFEFEEVFLTNAIQGIKSVAYSTDLQKNYTSNFTKTIIENVQEWIENSNKIG